MLLRLRRRLRRRRAHRDVTVAHVVVVAAVDVGDDARRRRRRIVRIVVLVVAHRRRGAAMLRRAQVIGGRRWAVLGQDGNGDGTSVRQWWAVTVVDVDQSGVGHRRRQVGGRVDEHLLPVSAAAADDGSTEVRDIAVAVDEVAS